MKALILKTAEGPGSAAIEEVKTPRPAAGEVLVRLQAASLNHRELWISRGLYPTMSLPTTMGADGAGIIEAVGDGVDGAQIGREVVLYPGLDWGNDERFPSDRFGLLGMPGPGTIAEAICVPASSVHGKPVHLNWAQAAALPVAGVTAFRALNAKSGLASGEKVLITGIGGGVATFGLLFAKEMGASVFVTSGSKETLDKAKQLGATDGFDYGEEQWAKKLRTASGGIDVVLDGAPGPSLPSYMRALAMGARVVVYGSTGGPAFKANAPDLFLKHASILGTAMGSPAEFQAMLDFTSEHKIEPAIDRTFPFLEAPQALLHLEQGHGLGKVVIDIGETCD